MPSQPTQPHSSIEALNARIARLALALGVPLDEPQAVQALMHQPLPVAPAVDRRCGRPHCHPGEPERRVAHQREELRGLLVLRYHLEAHDLSEQGYTVTREVWMQARAHLVQQGFRPGADGLSLDALFADPTPKP